MHHVTSEQLSASQTKIKTKTNTYIFVHSTQTPDMHQKHKLLHHKLHKVVSRQKHLPGRCVTSEQPENKTKRRNKDANYQHAHIKYQVHLIVPKTP